jgi:hypothetical protein
MTTSIPRPPGPPTVYRVDRDNNLCYVNPTFLDFAADNEMQMDGSHLLGRSLWDFIADQHTVRLYRELLQQVRDEDRMVHFSYRCDSPDVKRFMHMVVTPVENDEVEFESWIRRVEPQNPKLVFEAKRVGRHKPIRVCSICRSVETEPGEWTNVSDAFARGHIPAQEHRVSVIYKVCPTCVSTISSQASGGQMSLNKGYEKSTG